MRISRKHRGEYMASACGKLAGRVQHPEMRKSVLDHDLAISGYGQLLMEKFSKLQEAFT